jgi:hypothetical protein
MSDVLRVMRWYAGRREDETPYGHDISYDIWVKVGDGSSVNVNSRGDVDQLIELLKQVREALPPDDQTDFESVCVEGKP